MRVNCLYNCDYYVYMNKSCSDSLCNGNLVRNIFFQLFNLIIALWKILRYLYIKNIRIIVIIVTRLHSKKKQRIYNLENEMNSRKDLIFSSALIGSRNLATIMSPSLI